MAWTDVSGTQWKYTGYNYRGDLYLKLQYNDATASPTSVSVRFVMYRADTSIKYSDGFGVLLNPTNSDGSMSSNIKFLKLKDATAGDFSTPWPADDYASNSFTLEKNYSDATFALPPFWFVNTWARNTAVQSAALSGNPANVFFYAQDATGANSQGAARRYKTVFGASSLAIASSSTVAGNVTAYKPNIINNKNNTFSISVSAGGKGTNNPVKSTTLYYRIGDSGSFTKASSLSASGSLTCGAGSKSQYVYAYSVVEGTYGSSVTSATASLEIPNYAVPSAPGTPTLYSSSLKNGRLTVKQNWTYSWAAATPANTSSPIKGYRIRLFKNDSPITGLTGSASNNNIGKGTGSLEYLDRESTSCTVTFNPNDFGFAPKDKVRLNIYSYTRNGANTQLFNGNGASSAAVWSAETTVQNAGIMRVKVGNSWKEGQVWVKAGDKWYEAETVNVKTSEGWKESQ